MLLKTPVCIPVWKQNKVYNNIKIHMIFTNDLSISCYSVVARKGWSMAICVLLTRTEQMFTELRDATSISGVEPISIYLRNKQLSFRVKRNILTLPQNVSFEDSKKRKLDFSPTRGAQRDESHL